MVLDDMKKLVTGKNSAPDPLDKRLILILIAIAAVIALIIVVLTHTKGNDPSGTDTASDKSEIHSDFVDKNKFTTPGWKNPDASTLKDFSFTLNNVSFTLPFDFEKLTSLGYKMSDEEFNYEIGPNDFYTGSLYDDTDNYIASLYFYNNSSDKQILSDCMVVGISISKLDTSFDFDFKIGSIDFSSKEDTVVNYFGTSGDLYKTDDPDLRMYTWYGNNYSANYFDSLNISYQDGKITSISLMYRGEL